MEFTLENFIKSGAVRHICYYADTECGRPVDWNKVGDYISREFRDAPFDERLILLLHCKESYDEAMKLNSEVPV